MFILDDGPVRMAELELLFEYMEDLLRILNKSAGLTNFPGDAKFFMGLAVGAVLMGVLGVLVSPSVLLLDMIG